MRGIIGMKKGSSWSWYILLIFYSVLLAVNFEPLKTVNEMYSASRYLLISLFFISGTIGFTLAFRKGKKNGDFTRNVGRELGREMRKELEENWKRHIVAGVVAVGCGLPVVLLKSSWYITIVVVFISFQIADYALSKLFKKGKMG